MIVVKDWRPLIVEMVMAKQDLAAWDPKEVFPHAFPELAASREVVDDLQLKLGLGLDEEHGNFLTFANGWKGFYQSVDLLTSAELVSSPQLELANEAFFEFDDLFESMSVRSEDMFPVAASVVQADVFAMRKTGGEIAREVYWIAEGELIDTFESFGQWFASMIEYTRLQKSNLQAEARQLGIVE